MKSQRSFIKMNVSTRSVCERSSLYTYNETSYEDIWSPIGNMRILVDIIQYEGVGGTNVTA